MQNSKVNSITSATFSNWLHLSHDAQLELKLQETVSTATKRPAPENRVESYLPDISEHQSIIN